jgi:hypothetical protein
MANLLDRILSATGLKPPASEDNNSIYRDDGKTGVEKYLAKQTEEETLKAASGKTATGVDKYLQKQPAADKSVKVKVAKKMSGSTSGVAKYLEGQAKGKSTAGGRGAKSASGANKRSAVKKKPAPAPKRAAKSVAKKPAPAKKAQATKKVASKALASGAIDLSKEMTQCQAGTAKGTQCKRTAQLSKIQRTVDKKKYQFTVCSQHDNKSFKPYDNLI